MLWPAAGRRYQVLAIRDFRLLLADRLLAPFSVGFSMVGVSFAVLKVTGSTADLSYVLAAQAAPMIVFSLLGGVFADRFKPQWVIIAGNLCVMVGEGVFGILMLYVVYKSVVFRRPQYAINFRALRPRAALKEA